jgi:hypothetical protein
VNKKYDIGPDVDLDQEDVRDSQNRRITEEYAEQAATEALETARRGRPSLSGGRVHSPQVTFRLSRETEARAREAAKREGKTVSQLAREALERYLAS